MCFGYEHKDREKPLLTRRKDVENFLSLIDYTFDFEILHKNKLYPATKIIARV